MQQVSQHPSTSFNRRCSNSVGPHRKDRCSSDQAAAGFTWAGIRAQRALAEALAGEVGEDVVQFDRQHDPQQQCRAGPVGEESEVGGPDAADHEWVRHRQHHLRMH